MRLPASMRNDTHVIFKLPLFVERWLEEDQLTINKKHNSCKRNILRWISLDQLVIRQNPA